MNTLTARIERFLQGMGEGVTLLLQAAYWCKAAPRNLDKILAHLLEFGNATLPIASLMAIFIGGVLALQTGSRLAQFGLEGNIGGIVGLSMVKELGPVMTALLVAGRVGSAIAAEVGAMNVYEEIDALRTLNINPVRYLVMPRLLASLIAVPALCMYVNVIGLLGGALVSAVNPKIHVSVRLFRLNFQEVVKFSDVMDSLFKSVVFGMAVAITCCYVGLRTTGGPEEIGRSVTRSVVLSFMFIFVLNYLITRSLM
ncbi:MAG TPA: ABC transporter permease [Candidatus Methylomirabilis sp.]|nr:ABC transporter permease [Candidatus Methylomirabilis sp.]HSC71565.1 ABC transporter permease [Candidatus Methylomirabilis sp.]